MSKPPGLPCAFLIAVQMCLLLTTVHVYKLYLLTYLLNYMTLEGSCISLHWAIQNGTDKTSTD